MVKILECDPECIKRLQIGYQNLISSSLCHDQPLHKIHS